ncbi:hypothetical protein L210DRAFT_932925 [Boletus edulis BED1]|uniref:Uncharacterized protein n=1 Tax=Boletus edulis BED1 TaxID=1328754 RepID=A0AAD4BKI9_BOLED|nr:hypothetical protein L210DRAFT_932925 [Boletus edulis BED1]
MALDNEEETFDIDPSGCITSDSDIEADQPTFTPATAGDHATKENCNPATFPELISEDEQGWFFSSSTAEQMNVWIGGYHAICREMVVDKYDFFLDQMILHCNRVTRAKLNGQGSRLSNWPIISLSTAEAELVVMAVCQHASVLAIGTSFSINIASMPAAANSDSSSLDVDYKPEVPEPIPSDSKSSPSTAMDTPKPMRQWFSGEAWLGSCQRDD